jgi:hypothetical protein
LVGVDDHICVWQLNISIHQRWQVVVRHQHLQTQRLGSGYALKTGNAVVYRYQHICAAVFHALRYWSGQSIAIHHAVGHDVAHVLCTQQAQAPNGYCACRRTITIVVRHNAQPFVFCNRICQQHSRIHSALQASRRQQQRQAIVQLFFATYPPRSVQTRQQRMHPRLLKRPSSTWRNIAGGDFHEYGLVVKCYKFNSTLGNKYDGLRSKKLLTLSIVRANALAGLVSYLNAVCSPHKG